jgi:hypothetical protein
MRKARIESIKEMLKHKSSYSEAELKSIRRKLKELEGSQRKYELKLERERKRILAMAGE